MVGTSGTGKTWVGDVGKDTFPEAVPLSDCTEKVVSG